MIQCPSFTTRSTERPQPELAQRLDRLLPTGHLIGAQK